MNNSINLLDKTTQLLAYAGNKNSQNGYPNMNFRNNALSISDLERLIKKLTALLKSDTPVNDVPQNIVFKINELKSAFNSASSNDKNELITYLDDLEINSMHGGRKKRTLKKRRSNKKTRRNRRR